MDMLFFFFFFFVVVVFLFSFRGGGGRGIHIPTVSGWDRVLSAHFNSTASLKYMYHEVYVS